MTMTSFPKIDLHLHIDGSLSLPCFQTLASNVGLSMTDAQIRNALETRRGDRTTFLISHRISTLSHADIILVLEDGRLVQQGTAEELLKVPGLYRELYEIQSARKKQEELL